MGFSAFIVETYIGLSLAGREQSLLMPIPMLVRQAVALCKKSNEDGQPIRLVFINEDGETLEYKTPAYIKFEEDKK